MSEIGNIQIARKLWRQILGTGGRGSAEVVSVRRSAEGGLAFEAAGRVAAMMVFGPAGACLSSRRLPLRVSRRA